MRTQLQRAGQDISELPVPVVLREPLTFFMSAYADLSTTRSAGMSLMPISVLAVEEYCRIYDYTSFQRFFLHNVVRSLDPILMEHIGNDSKRRKGGKNA